jgi:cytoskeletal protein RodZ
MSNMFMENKMKTMWTWVVIAIVVIIIGGIWFFTYQNNRTVTTTNTNNTATTEPESVQDISAQDIGVGAVSISYADALIKYADRRIQIDKTCQASPHTVTYKDNTGVMIDNRSPQTHTIKLGTTFTIKPYGFKIIVLPDVYLKSKTLLIDCDQSQNVATVLVQE